MPRQIFDNDEPLLDYNSMDEISELGMGDRGYTNVDPPYGSNEIFGDQFERRAREIQRMPAGSQPVIIVPSKSGPWSGNNQLGNEQGFAPSANNRQTILKMDEWGFPQVWTVQLGMSFTDSTNAFFQVVAVVKAGVGGTTQTFEVDWAQGMSFSCVFNALNVEAFYGETTSVPNDIRLSVQIGKRSLSSARPTRTIRINLTGLATTAQIRVPAFAKTFTPIRFKNVDPFAATQTYEFAINDIGTPNVVAQLSGPQLLDLGGTMILPNGANFLNFTGAAQSGFAAVFELSV